MTDFFDYLDESIANAAKELALEGIAELTKVEIQENEGKFSLVFVLDYNNIYINLAAQNDSDQRKRMCGINIFNTLYTLTNSKNNVPFKIALNEAQQICPCRVKYKFKESFNESNNKSYKNLVKLEFVEKIELPF